jgi:hypothetical protein
VNDYRIFFVGTESEVAHHAAPIHRIHPVEIVPPERITDVIREGDLAVYFSEHFHRFRNAWFQAHVRGCLSVYAIDGILEWRNAWENGVEEPACPWTMRPVLSQKVACIGAAQAAVLDSWGNSGKTEITGLPRLDPSVACMPKRVDAPCSRGNRQTLRLLVATAKWPFYTAGQFRLVKQSLKDLFSYSLAYPTLPGVTLDWHWRLTGGLDSEIGVNNSSAADSGKTLPEILASVDAVITTPSTLALEAMLVGLPVVLLDYTNSPAWVPAAWSITARSHIADVVPRLVAPEYSRLHWQRHLLAQNLQMSEPAAERMVRLCREMIRLAHDCRASKKPVAFPERILDVPHSPGVPLDYGICWPKKEKTLAGTSEPEFQSLADENRRQLEVLQRRTELLESELARAADGFQRIASHPILGPLLKVRETAIRFGNQIGQVLARDNARGEPSGNDSVGNSNNAGQRENGKVG